MKQRFLILADVRPERRVPLALNWPRAIACAGCGQPLNGERIVYLKAERKLCGGCFRKADSPRLGRRAS